MSTRSMASCRRVSLRGLEFGKVDPDYSPYRPKRKAKWSGEFTRINSWVCVEKADSIQLPHSPLLLSILIGPKMPDEVLRHFLKAFWRNKK